LPFGRLCTLTRVPTSRWSSWPPAP